MTQEDKVLQERIDHFTSRRRMQHLKFSEESDKMKMTCSSFKSQMLHRLIGCLPKTMERRVTKDQADSSHCCVRA